MFPGMPRVVWLSRITRERAGACTSAHKRVCATSIACAAAVQKPNELECLLSCLRSPLCARLPARLSPRVGFETRIKQTALMLDPCRSEFLGPSSFHRFRRHASDIANLPARRDRLIEATRNRLSDAIAPRIPTLQPDHRETQLRTLTCRCARLSASNCEHCERSGAANPSRRLRDNGEIKRRWLDYRAS